jgi:RTX calcium-binding nonapeptide repeat (4 copies)
MRKLLLKKCLNPLALLRKEIINLLSKRDLVIIIFFTILGLGGVFAATLITIATPDSQGAGYVRATACDESVNISASSVLNNADGQFYVPTISLSEISQNISTGCGNKVMQIALKINNQVRYASWNIPAGITDSTFYLTNITSSLGSNYADNQLTQFKVTDLTNVAISQIGTYTPNRIEECVASIADPNWTKTTLLAAIGKTEQELLALVNNNTWYIQVAADASFGTNHANDPDIYCGDSNNNYVPYLDSNSSTLDYFIGGAGNDSVNTSWNSIFYGGEGNDSIVSLSETSRFYGGAGTDTASSILGGSTFYQVESK